MKNQSRTGYGLALAVILWGSAICVAPAIVGAGPVPGLDQISKQPVEFDTPESLTVWITDDEDYLVTFRWRPDFEVRNPAVAGSFNGWSRTELPMEGPDEEGFFSVTARLPAGEFEYKFVGNTDGWFADPLNPDRADTPFEPNNILRLGFAAILRDRTAKRGDGIIEGSALLHNPDMFTYLDQFNEEDITLRVRALRGDVEGAQLVLFDDDGQEMALVDMELFAHDALFEFFTTTMRTGQMDALPAAYTFRLIDGDKAYQKAKPFPFHIKDSQIKRTPEWAKDAIWYQIMIDRFRDGDPTNNPEFTLGTNRSPVTHPWTSEWYEEQPWERLGGATFWRWSMYARLYGGDFQGVIDKLDYLQSLGVNAIYFNPVFDAHTPHKYNARTFVHTDDGYGVAGEFQRSLEAHDRKDYTSWEFNKSDLLFLELIQEARKRNMRVIIDAVWNHVGDDHPAFLDVRENLQESRYADWFDIRSWDPFVFSGWAGFTGLPEFAKKGEDLASESLKEYIFAVTRRWMDPHGNGDLSAGVDGWRLDVPNHVGFDFWEEWVELVKSINPDAYIVGEIWDPAEEWIRHGRFDAVMNYQFAKAAFPWFSNVERKTTVSEFDNALKRLYIRYPRNATFVMQNLYDSHDTDRWVSRIANPDLPYDAMNRIQDTGPNFFDERPDEIHYQRKRLMAVFQATWLGAPMIWYGTEVGMYGADDPRNRMPMWWEDLMPYDSPTYFIDYDHKAHFTELFHLRQREEILRRGDFKTALIDDARDVYGYLRYIDKGESAILVILNNGSQDIAVPLSDVRHGFHGAPEILFGPATMDGDTINLPSLQGAVIRLGDATTP